MIGAMSGGEQRYLMIAASLGAGGDRVNISLENEIAGLDRSRLQLVLAAIAHAGGASAPGRVCVGFGHGQLLYEDTDALYLWP